MLAKIIYILLQEKQHKCTASIKLQEIIVSVKHDFYRNKTYKVYFQDQQHKCTTSILSGEKIPRNTRSILSGEKIPRNTRSILSGEKIPRNTRSILSEKTAQVYNKHIFSVQLSYSPKKPCKHKAIVVTEINVTVQQLYREETEYVLLKIV